MPAVRELAAAAQPPMAPGLPPLQVFCAARKIGELGSIPLLRLYPWLTIPPGPNFGSW